MAALRDPHVAEMLARTFMIVLFVGSLFGMAIGAGLLFRSEAMLRFFATMNRWVSTRRVLKPLEITHTLGGQPAGQAAGTKQRWIVGILFAAGGAYAGYVLTTAVDAGKVVWLFGIYGTLAPAAFVLIDTVRWFIVAGCATAVVAGVMLLAFPDAWRAVEVRANQWYSTRQLALGGDAMHLTLDRWVELFPRAAGALIAALCLIPLVTSAVLLFGRL